MLKIYKITSNNVVDFAAEELKKYLRMMMPRCGEISIEYKPDATEGFRLGLMSDFSLDTSEAEDIELDDIVHIDTDENGGIIAGDNPRSVLFAVYRYLYVNGCRWLYPGVDGEFIPIKNVEPVKYHKMADCRYRGQCNEGSEYQANMMEVIDFTPKLGLNIFMIEFDIPNVYYDRYYAHTFNAKYRDAEPVTSDTILQWKRQCEAEISKRGLQCHDMGHGWTAEVIGANATADWNPKPDLVVDPDRVEFIAEVKGKRELYRAVPLNTNICMSNPRARKIFVDKVVEYAKEATNVDYLHVWLADGMKNHCECSECRKKTPSDWYVMIMNEIDDALIAEKLATRIVFCCYVDTTYPPVEAKLNNPERFSLLIGAITRSYCTPVPSEVIVTPMEDYVLNKMQLPKLVEEYLTYANEWKKRTGVRGFMYEYHFWRHQFFAPGLFKFSKVVYDDVRGYKAYGVDGIIEDGSQRAFFPNGFAFYVYGQTLFDTSLKFDDIKEDYFSHAYGEKWHEVEKFFLEIDELYGNEYLDGKKSLDYEKGKYYNPEFVAKFEKAISVADEFSKFIEENKNSIYRVQTVSMRILRRYAEYLRGLSSALVLKANGDDEGSKAQFKEFFLEFGKYELEIERYYDHELLGKVIFKELFGASADQVVFI